MNTGQGRSLTRTAVIGVRLLLEDAGPFLPSCREEEYVSADRSVSTSSQSQGTGDGCRGYQLVY